MKKLVLILLSLMLIFTACQNSNNVTGSNNNGSGNGGSGGNGNGDEENLPPADLYIRTVDDLVAFSDKVNAGNNYLGKTVLLVKDIDMSSVQSFKPIGNGINSDHIPFSGTFDGNGKTIKNIKISTEYSDNAGFFGRVKDGFVKNLTIENASIKKVDATSSVLIGVIAGSIIDSKIEFCTNKGGVIDVKGDFVGGIVGISWTENSSVKECESTGEIKITYDGFPNIGGIVGENSGASILNCVNKANIKVTIKLDSPNSSRKGGIAGIVGKATGKSAFVRDSKNYGNITCDYNYTGLENILIGVGGVIGMCDSSSTKIFQGGNIQSDKDILNSFYNSGTISFLGHLNKAGKLVGRADIYSGKAINSANDLK